MIQVIAWEAAKLYAALCVVMVTGLVLYIAMAYHRKRRLHRAYVQAMAKVLRSHGVPAVMAEIEAEHFVAMGILRMEDRRGKLASASVNN